MSTIVVDVPTETYERLQEEARKAGKSPEVLTRELLETSLRAREGSDIRLHERFYRLQAKSGLWAETCDARSSPESP